MWFITQCFGVGFRGSHRAGDSVPLPGPPHPPDMAPPDMAPDPHDDGDFEGPDTRSLLDEFMAKMSQSVNDDYKSVAVSLLYRHPFNKNKRPRRTRRVNKVCRQYDTQFSCFPGLFMY